jgi:Ca2+-binding EF-hand superfamily protein
MGSDTSKSKKRATQLTEEEIQLLLKNTHFNRQQIKEWHQGFLVSNQFYKYNIKKKEKRHKFRILIRLIK